MRLDRHPGNDRNFRAELTIHGTPKAGVTPSGRFGPNRFRPVGTPGRRIYLSRSVSARPGNAADQTGIWAGRAFPIGVAGWEIPACQRRVGLVPNECGWNGSNPIDRFFICFWQYRRHLATRWADCSGIDQKSDECNFHFFGRWNGGMRIAGFCCNAGGDLSGLEQRPYLLGSGSCSAPGVCQRDGVVGHQPGRKLNQSLKGLHAAINFTRRRLSGFRRCFYNRSKCRGVHNTRWHISPVYPLPGNLLVDYAWSPAGDELAVVMAMRSDYSGKVLGNRNFLVSPQTLAITEYPQSNLFEPARAMVAGWYLSVLDRNSAQ